MAQKVALVTGVTGQDGSYLAELLLEKGYEVHGVVRRASTLNRARIDHLHTPGDTTKEDEKDRAERFHLHYADLSDAASLNAVLAKCQPDEVYNLAAQSHVAISFEIPEYTGEVSGLGTIRLLEAIRTLDKEVKFYQASTSELFGKVKETPQTEKTPFHPRSPYGVAKLYSFWITKNYREAYDLFAVNGILFNHESERRGKNFVSRKITHGLCEVKLGKRETLYLGNLDAKRDWGHARDYVEAMWLMLQADKPDDYVIASGETHTVREFVEEACAILEIPLEWRGSGLEEVGVDSVTGKTIIAVSPKFFRPSEVDILLGDPSRAKQELGWKPKVSYKELVRLMVESDLKMLQDGTDHRF